MLRMGGQDAAFIYGETPEWHMHVSAVMIADPSDASDFSFERVRDMTIERLPQLPQFRWKMVDVPLGLDRPGWVEETDFDPDFHIRRVAVPAPGGEAELGELVGRLASYKLDRRKPLWEMWFIEGLTGGKVAVLTKIHHAIIDGVSGAGLAEITLDLTPEPRSAPTETRESIAHRRVPSTPEMVARGLFNTFARSPYRAMRFGGQTMRQGVAALGVARRTTLATPYSAPRTTLNGPLTPRRRFAAARVDLDRVKALRRAYDVKLNDIVLALCSGALRSYLMDIDDLPRSPLIAQCPVSLRTADDKHEVGNKVGSLFASLATDLDDPAARVRVIHESTQGAKEMQRALSVHRIMGLTETTPPGLIGLAARAYSISGLGRAAPPPVNLVISNVPGPTMPLYLAGARLEAMYPMGPLLFDMALNITVLSYCDAIDFGFMACPELIPDPGAIASRIDDALEELESTIGIGDIVDVRDAETSDAIRPRDPGVGGAARVEPAVTTREPDSLPD